MIGIGTGLWPVALQSILSGAPPGVTYGRSINVLFGTPSNGPVSAACAALSARTGYDAARQRQRDTLLRLIAEAA